MKSSGIGGQAVLEGVMMKNQDEYAVAVRLQNKEIVVQKNKYVSMTKRHPILGIPIVRGVVNFIESLVIGTKTLTYSSSLFEEEEEDDKKDSVDHSKANKNKKSNAKEEKSSSDGIMIALTVMASIILAVGIFMLLPFLVGDLLSNVIESSALRALVEGIIRFVIFIGYIIAISQMKDIKRVFMYHGAEHKTINCIEHGFELTVENVRKQSKEHKRCGTSFMLIVMVVSVIFFIFIRVDTLWLRMIYRILLIPVIAGVSYEFIRLAGRTDNKFVAILSKPGLWLQGLTTKEPDDEMIEVAIKSVEAVFDWKKYLAENKSETKTKKHRSNVSGNNVIDEKTEDVEEIILAEVNLDRFNKKLTADETVDDEEDVNIKKESTTKELKPKENRKKKNSQGSKKKGNVSSKETQNIKETKVEEAKSEYASASIENVVHASIDEDDEDDEILRALDRYFDTPNAKVLEEDD